MIKKTLLAMAISVAALMFLNVGSSLADFGFVSLDLNKNEVSYKNGEISAKVVVNKYAEVPIDRVCVAVNNPWLTGDDVLPMGQFCHREGKGFYNYGDKFWKNGARISVDSSYVEEDKDTKSYVFTWSYPRLYYVDQVSDLRGIEVSAALYDTGSGRSATVTTDLPTFDISGAPPILVDHEVAPYEVLAGGDESLKVSLELAHDDPETIDRVIVALNRKLDTARGMIAWTDAKGANMNGGAKRNGNDFVSEYSVERSLEDGAAVFDFEMSFEEGAELDEELEVKVYYRDANKYSPGWHVVDSSAWIVAEKDDGESQEEGEEPEEEEEESEPQPDPVGFSLGHLCEITIVDLDCSAFVPDTGDYYFESTDRNVIYVVPPVSGEVVVRGDGSQANPFNSLQAADIKAVPGDMVYLAPGDYLDCLSTDDCFELQFATNDVIWYGPGAVLNSAGTSVRGLYISASDVVVDGLTIRGFTGAALIMSQERGNPDNAPRGTVLRNLTVEMPTIDGPTDGIKFNGYHHGATFKNVKVLNATQGIASNEDQYVNNILMDGVYVENRVYGTGSGDDTIGFAQGRNFLLYDVVVTGAGADGIDVKGENVLVANAVVENVGRNGIKLWKNADVINARVFGTGGDGGIILGGGSKYRLANVMMTGHTTDGYLMTVNHGESIEGEIEIVNSVFANNPKGIYFSPSIRVTLRNNLLQPGYLNGVVFYYGDHGLWTGLDWSDLAGVSGMSVSGNLPLDTDPMIDGEFKSVSGSPLIDAGTDALTNGLPVIDLAGGERVKGDRIDIGPYEL